MTEQIFSFWKWFTEQEEYIYYHLEKEPDDLAFLISEQLRLIDDNLVFEISFEKEENRMSFVISADGDITLFPLVIEICGESPEFERWNIVPFRPRLHQKNQVIDIEGIKLDYDDIYFTYSMEDEYINLDVYIKGYDQEDNRYIHTYFILLDSLIGEYDAVTRIGITTVYSYSDDTEVELFNIRELLKIIDFLKDQEITSN